MYQILQKVKKTAKRQNLSKWTIDTYCYNIKSFLVWCNKPFIQIKKKDVTNYLDFLVEKNYSPNSLNVAYSSIKFRQIKFIESIGATLTAHSVGSAIWIWSVPMTSELWLAVFNVAWFERLIFAIGITVSYYSVNAVLHTLSDIFQWKIPSNILSLEKNKFF